MWRRMQYYVIVKRSIAFHRIQVKRQFYRFCIWSVCYLLSPARPPVMGHTFYPTTIATQRCIHVCRTTSNAWICAVCSQCSAGSPRSLMPFGLWFCFGFFFYFPSELHVIATVSIAACSCRHRVSPSPSCDKVAMPTHALLAAHMYFNELYVWLLVYWNSFSITVAAVIYV